MNPGQSNDTFIYVDEAGEHRAAEGVVILSGGNGSSSPYTLASNVTLAANAAGAATSGIIRGNYIFDVQFVGVSVQLQSLGADGMTWRNVGSPLTQPGSLSIALGQGSAVRLFNPNGTALTGVYATLS